MKQLELSNEIAKAITVAVNAAEADSEFVLSDYFVLIIEKDNSPDIIFVTFTAKDRPKGWRGAVPGKQEATYAIDKKSGKIIKKTWAR